MSRTKETTASTAPNVPSMETTVEKEETEDPPEQEPCDFTTPPSEISSSKPDTGEQTAGEPHQPSDEKEERTPPPRQPSDDKVGDKVGHKRKESSSHKHKETCSHKRKESSGHKRKESSSHKAHSPTASRSGVSEWSHQQLAPHPQEENGTNAEDETWQTMPAYAPFDIYDDDGKLVAKEHVEETEEPQPGYAGLGGQAKGYTRVQNDDDAQSATSMDDNTAYLFKNPVSNQLDTEDEEARDVAAQMQTTKKLLTDNQRIAYVGLVKLAAAEMSKEIATIERTRGSRKLVDLAVESLLLWAQKMMVRLYAHMELEAAEQMMIEQLSEHGLQASDLSPTLKVTNHVKNPMSEDAPNPVPERQSEDNADSSKSDTKVSIDEKAAEEDLEQLFEDPAGSLAPPPYSQEDGEDHVPPVQDQSELLKQAEFDVDLRWTVLCDLFLILISDSMYDARSRVLLEKVAAYLDVPWLDVARFEKRITEALEMEEEARKEDWNEDDHLAARRKQARNRRLALMGLATVGGGLVIGLSAGLLAPVIGAGLAAGFTTIGVTGTSGFLAGAGGAAFIGGVGTLTGGTIGVRAANRRTGAVKTFEYRPLHDNKRVNLVVTVAGWMNGKVDDVRLPYSTIDPIMGDIYSILWEPEMLRSMGDTINILATEALTQGLQQVLGSTILMALMAAIQLPMALSKLAYLIDNPWSVSVSRADAAGLILADSLVERNLGARPITLVGFSLGSRVIFSCLRELASKGAVGLIQNVYIFGSPVVVRKDEYLRARAIVSGRFVNGYASNDWILGYLFRATGGGIMRVAGLAEVEVPGIENVDVTQIVPGHMSYRQCMPRLMREVGWAVESDEFSEIEDPDPDNHEKRQRELINEIEEARKELEKQPEKRKFGFFKRNKKGAQKKEWETYDDRLRNGDADHGGDPNGPLFDIDAIRNAAVELASEGINVTELESTMPTMKINTGLVSPSTPVSVHTPLSGPSNASPRLSSSTRPSTEAHLTLTSNGNAKPSELSKGSYFPEHNRNQSDVLYYENEEVTLSFEPEETVPPSLPPNLITGSSRAASIRSATGWQGDHGNGDLSVGYAHQNGSSRSLSIDRKSTWSPVPVLGNSPYRSPGSSSREKIAPSQTGKNAASPLNTDRNVWADEEEDFGHEKEFSMTFE